MKIKNIQDIEQTHNTTVFVSGVSGQDGSLMTDYLLKNEPEVTIIGGARRLSVENHKNIAHLENEPRFQLVNFDLTDSHSIYKLIEYAKPDYFINFAAQSFVASSWDFARQTWQCNSTAILDCLEAIKRLEPTCRFYNAGSSEEFGNVEYNPQDELHPPKPRSPYGASKVAARTLIKVYRESYGMYAVQGWLFNHEGTRRGEEFVTRKITKGVAKIKKTIDMFNNWPEGIAPRELVITPIELGNVDAKRDWSDAEDMVDAVWRMLNQDKYNRVLKSFMYDEPQPLHEDEEPTTVEKQKWLVRNIKDYVVSSDENHTIREFVERAFRYAGIDNFVWDGTGVDEKLWYRNKNDYEYLLVNINPKFYRPADVEVLKGDSSEIRKDLGWKPQSDFKTLVKKMVLHDLSKS